MADKPRDNEVHWGRVRTRLWEIVFETNDPAGKAFDVVLIVSIAASVLAVMLDSMRAVHDAWGGLLYAVEWFFTVLFTVEYVLRLWISPRPLHYARSFFGVVDLLAVLPTYLSVLLPGSQYLLVIRVLRVLRVFRVLKFMRFVREATTLMNAIRSSGRKVAVFLFTIITLVIILGSVMYLVEGVEHGFTSIPKSIYWAIVTLTTVGYGDISPQTDLGQVIAALVMLLGYSIIAVPTGIVSAELTRAVHEERKARACLQCGATGHDHDAGYCKDCGQPLTEKG